MEEEEKIITCDSCKKKIHEWDAFSLNENDTLCFDCFHRKKPKDDSSTEKTDSIFSVQHDSFLLKLKQYERAGLLIIAFGMIIVGFLFFNFVLDFFFNPILRLRFHPEWFIQEFPRIIWFLIVAITLTSGGLLIIFYQMRKKNGEAQVPSR